MDLRIGQGFDIHRLKEGRPCWIGGVLIESELGPDGHSDADVLLHAVIDALLGAAGLGDIGEHFPDTDERWKGADSSKLTEHVVGLVSEAGWKVVNLDASVITQVPKLKPHKAAMEARIAELLHVTPDRVNIKGKTHEKVDAIGEKRAIAVHCSLLLMR